MIDHTSNVATPKLSVGIPLLGRAVLYAALAASAPADTALSLAFMLGRTLFGHLPDIFGGACLAFLVREL